MPAPESGTASCGCVPRRQPVERSCCMSQATLVDTSSTAPAIEADRRVLEAERGHQHDAHHERRRDRIRVADAERDAVDHREHEHQQHRDHQIDQRLVEQADAEPRPLRPPRTATHDQQALGVDALPGGSCSTAWRRPHLGARQRATAESGCSDMSTMRRAHDHAERDQERDLAKRLAGVEPADRHERRGSAPMPVSPATSAGTPMRAPTIMPAPNVEVDSSIAPSSASLADAMPPTSPSADAAGQAGHRAAQQHRIGQRAQDVGDRQAGRKRQPQAVDQDRRVEHAHADAEHADRTPCRASAARWAAAAGPATPSPGAARPCRAHAGHRGSGRLHVVGAVLAVGRRSRR